MVLAYTPRCPDVYAVPVLPVKPLSSSSSVVDSLVVEPVTVRVGLSDKMTPCLHTGTSCSIQQLGGIKCFLFLFAKVCGAFVSVLFY